ncbi:MAG TPA: metallophosphoesterase [Blastocatellia bacterium]|nr:metallophosphoesterase [Blastocatellia bacterium]
MLGQTGSASRLCGILVALASISSSMPISCTRGGPLPKHPVNAGRSGPIAPVYSGDLSSRQGIHSFIFVGDTQRTSVWELAIGREQNDAARQAVLDKIAGEAPAFLVILGDLVFQGDDPAHWDRFDEFTSKIREAGIPVFPLLGNHEYFGNHEKAFDLFFSRFPHLSRQFWYTIQFSSVAIILLDSNLGEMSQNMVGQQDDWYRKKLVEYENDPAVKVVIVCCHHAPFTNSTVVSDDAAVQTHFVGPFKNTPKARLFITGHCHSYERFVQFGKQFVVSGGGGGPRQPLIVDKKRRRHEDMYNGGAIREFHFCKVTLEQGRPRLEMWRLDKELRNWSMGDQFVLD